MKYCLFTFVLFLLVLRSNAQHFFKSSQYGYTIEIPRGFIEKSATGKNVNLKATDRNGSSLIIVVKRLPIEAQGASPHDMNSLSNEQLRSSLSEYGDGVEILSKGTGYINGHPAFYIRYNHDELYTICYTLTKGAYLYSISANCSPSIKAHMGPYFFRAIQSFKM